MTVRIIVEQVDTGAAAAGVPGARAEVSHRTFDIENEALEKWLMGPSRFVLGAHVVSDESQSDGER